MTISTFQRDDQALAQGAALQLRPNAGVLLLSDADRSDFLHRMTTNNINALKRGQSAVTVLTNATARLVFVFTVVCRDDSLWLLPAASANTGDANALTRHLRSQIFFMDKVKLRDASQEFTRMRLMGPKAAEVVAQWMAEAGGNATPLADDAYQSVDGVLVIRQEKYDIPGYELVIDNRLGNEVRERLNALGAIQLEEEAAYQARRIALGRPQVGQELTSDYNPLEAGLAWACAENKGCYTGQEIIARQVTYDKVTKSLVKLTCSTPVQPGQALQVEGKEVGTVTSATNHPEGTLPLAIALAIVKRPHNTAGNVLMVEGVACTVTELPAKI